MKIKTILPYLLFGSLAFIPTGTSEFHEKDDSYSLHAKTVTTQKIPTVQEQINAKAKELCDTYVDLVLQGQNNIKKARNHRKAVLSEFPGAFTRWYCIYGQYTQLNRAVAAMGDTLHFIPFEARHACPKFRSDMQKKYQGPEYAHALHNGKMFKSDADYNRALQSFLKHHRVTENTPDSVRNKFVEKFAANNFSAETLHQGSILIIQKNGTPSNTHAVMYMGRGRVEKGKFIPDSNGHHIYAGYNNESLDDIFKTYSTNRIFAVDIYDLATVEYSKELNKIKNMGDEDLFRFVYDVPSDMYVMVPNRNNLQQMAEQKYFHKDNYVPSVPLVTTNMASFPSVLPVYKKMLEKTK